MKDKVRVKLCVECGYDTDRLIHILACKGGRNGAGEQSEVGEASRESEGDAPPRQDEAGARVPRAVR